VTVLAAAAVVVAWLGGAFLVLSDARRGVALGVALYAVGLAVTLYGTPPAALALGLAGLAAAALRLRDGAPQWGTLPPGSTPRLLLCVVSGVLAGFVGASILEGPGPAPVRIVILLGGAMGAARLLSTLRREAALASTSAMTLAVGAAAAVSGGRTASTVVAAAAVAAVLLGVLPAAESEARGA
jgi:hypothetical protein